MTRAAADVPYFERRRREVDATIRSLFGQGPRFYRGPIAVLLGWSKMLVLTTTGRRTGVPRSVALTFMPLGRDHVVGAGMGERCDWYRNLLVHPEVTVQVGLRRFRARAVPVVDVSRRRDLVRRIVPYWDRYGPPGPMRWTMRRLLGFDYDEELRQAIAHADELPIVVLVTE